MPPIPGSEKERTGSFKLSSVIHMYIMVRERGREEERAKGGEGETGREEYIH